MVKTSVLFGKATSTVSSYVYFGPKGIIQKAVASNQFPSIDSNTLKPLTLKQAPKQLSIWKSDKLHVISEFENKVSRCLGLVRNDLIEDNLGSLVPAKGDSQVHLVFENKDEAFAASLAAVRNWPNYNQKTTTGKTEEEKDDNQLRNVYIDLNVQGKETVDLKELQVLADGIRQTQEFVDTPCSELNTTEMVQYSERLVNKLNDVYGANTVSIKVISGEKLHSEGFGGIYGVGKASTKPPALVVMSYTPESAKKTIALVGKVKHDMAGAAAVFSAYEVSVRNQVQNNVHALLCLAENSIGPKSMRNDDILYMHSGKTVEISNTDAEGRLVLADGVSYASKELSPDLIIDIATLTGAQLITTGVKHAGLLTKSEKIEKMIVDAGKVTGDLVFPMLYAPEILMGNFDSKVADMKNNVKDGMNAQSSCAGHFVESHLDANYKNDWAHIDIAGPGSKKERGTGFVISDAKHGSSTAVKVYHFFAGISAAIWIGMCILAWTDQSVLDLNVWTNLLNNDPENGLLIVDGISLLVSGFLFSLVETGVISFIKTVLLSALIGPGAALLINFADRESQSLGSQTVGSSKLKLQ
ncbi:putative aminopeptidase npepl1 [Globomyces sp. JEL0801]|nr:putative aminopeptidase npepl1 [Globomyces sp. JEL0801]